MEVFNYFVDLNQPESDIRYSKAVGKENIIFLVKSSNDAFAPHAGCISFKCTFSGEEYFEFDGRRVAVSPQNYLLLNKDQEYGSYIESKESVESFAIFFAPNFVTNALYTQEQKNDYLLDNSGKPTQVYNTPFYEKLYKINHNIHALTQAIRQHIQYFPNNSNTLLMEQHLCALLIELLKEQKDIQSTIEQLPSVRFSTRQEMYKRVSKARDYMHSCYGDDINIETLANVACLAPFHFLRTFKQVFQITPHQMLTKIRLEQAQNLLLNTKDSISQIGLNIGFDNLSSFTRLFTKAFGASPRKYRQENLVTFSK